VSGVWWCMQTFSFSDIELAAIYGSKMMNDDHFNKIYPVILRGWAWCSLWMICPNLTGQDTPVTCGSRDLPGFGDTKLRGK
jgi:hypothetical protein